MPIYITSRSASPFMSFIVGLAAIAITVGLVIFFLPLIAGVAIAAVVLVAAFLGWGWIKRKFGFESADERMFRETMESAEAMARAQFRGGASQEAAPGVYEREEIRVMTAGPSARRRVMKDVEDIEETPVDPKA